MLCCGWLSAVLHLVLHAAAAAVLDDTYIPLLSVYFTVDSDVQEVHYKGSALFLGS